MLVTCPQKNGCFSAPRSVLMLLKTKRQTVRILAFSYKHYRKANEVILNKTNDDISERKHLMNSPVYYTGRTSALSRGCGLQGPSLRAVVDINLNLDTRRTGHSMYSEWRSTFLLVYSVCVVLQRKASLGTISPWNWLLYGDLRKTQLKYNSVISSSGLSIRSPRNH